MVFDRFGRNIELFGYFDVGELFKSVEDKYHTTFRR
jgi:hypothetical protein